MKFQFTASQQVGNSVASVLCQILDWACDPENVENRPNPDEGFNKNYRIHELTWPDQRRLYIELRRAYPVRNDKDDPSNWEPTHASASWFDSNIVYIGESPCPGTDTYLFSTSFYDFHRTYDSRFCPWEFRGCSEWMLYKQAWES